MTRRRVVLYLVAAPVGFAVTALFYLTLNSFAPLQVAGFTETAAGRPLPAFSLPGLEDGAPGLSDADFGGEVTVLNLFASWCIPCEAEHPFISALASDEGLRVHGIAWMDDPAETRAWLARLGNAYDRIGSDRTAGLQADLGIKGVPTTFIVDAAGRIRYQREGPLVADPAISEFRAALEAARR